MDRITNEAQLRELLGRPAQTTEMKIHPAMTEQAMRFIRRAPIMFMATSDRAGHPTVSPKGDDPGFAHIVDERTLLIPERKGNRLLMSFQNLLENDRAALLFVVPGVTETLRLHGRASLHTDDALCAQMTALGKPALMLMKFEVTQCFFHCGKAFIRSQLWKPDSWPPVERVSFGEEMASKMCEVDKSVDREQFVHDLDQAVDKAYRDNL